MNETEQQVKKGRLLSALCLALGMTITAPQILGFKSELLYFTNSLLSVFLFAGLASLLYRSMDYEEISKQHIKKGSIGKRFGFPLVYSFSLTICMFLGSSLDSKHFLDFSGGLGFAALVFFTIGLAVMIEKCYRVLEKKEKLNVISETVLEEQKKRYGVKQFLLRMAALLFLWMPVFLAVYPGFFVYDAYDELQEVLQQSYHCHHPLLHVLLLGKIVYGIYQITGSYNAGIACYCILQAVFVSYTLVRVMEATVKFGMKKWLRVLFFLFYAFFPVILMYVFCTSKDTIFCCFLVLSILHLIDLFGQEQEFFTRKWNVAALLMDLTMMTHFRNNAFYAYLCFVCLVIAVRLVQTVRAKDGMTGAKKRMVRFSLLLLIPIVLHSGLQNVVKTAVSAKDTEHQEILTVPIMQLTRTYVCKPEVFTEEEKEILYRYLPESNLNCYREKLSDLVKVGFRNENYEKDPGTFWNLWLKKGVSNPVSYLTAWLFTSYGYWYPDTVVDVYRGNDTFTYTYQDSSYFGYEVEQPGVRESKIPWLNEIYRKLSLEIYQQKIPVVSMLFSMGFWFWFYLFALGYGIRRKRLQYVFPLSLVFFIWLTLLLGPTYLVRYTIMFWFLLPVCICMLLQVKKDINPV